MAVEQFPAAQTALEEYQSIEQQMASPEVVTNPDKMRKLGRRHAELGAIVSAYQSVHAAVRDDLEAAREMAGEDPEFADEAERLAKSPELPAGARRSCGTRCTPCATPMTPGTSSWRSRPGRAARRQRCSPATCCACICDTPRSAAGPTTVQSENTTELGGVKDVQIAIRAKGTPAPEDGVWASLKYEGGVHRVQRIPVTESQGRIQTSAGQV